MRKALLKTGFLSIISRIGGGVLGKEGSGKRDTILRASHSGGRLAIRRGIPPDANKSHRTRESCASRDCRNTAIGQVESIWQHRPGWYDVRAISGEWSAGGLIPVRVDNVIGICIRNGNEIQASL